jgi:hypothetical protein
MMKQRRSPPIAGTTCAKGASENESLPARDALKAAFADRMTDLLMQVPASDRDHTMMAVMDIIYREGAGLDVGDLNRSSPERFSEELVNAPGMSEWLALARETGFSPAGAESPEELALNLTPSDGHLLD